MTGPHLDVLRTRSEFFDACIGSAVEYLRELWPDDMAGIRFELYRLPIERLAHLHRDDEWHRRSFIESCVFRAVAELLGKDPWDIAPERYRHF